MRSSIHYVLLVTFTTIISVFALSMGASSSSSSATYSATETVVTWKKVPTTSVLRKGKKITLKTGKTYKKSIVLPRSVPKNAKNVRMMIKVKSANNAGKVVLYTKKKGNSSKKIVVTFKKGTTKRTIRVPYSSSIYLKANKKIKVNLYVNGYSKIVKVKAKPKVIKTATPTVKPNSKPSTSPEPPVAPPMPQKPGEGNTGVPAGTKLTVVNSGLTITKDDTVIDSMDIRGFVKVKANNVTIKNSIIRGIKNESNMHLVQNTYGGTNLKIIDSTLSAQFPSPYISGIVGENFTLKRVRINNVIDQVSITGDSVVIEDSWFHGNLHYEKDPNWNGKPSHDDNVQISKGKDIVMRHNVLESAKGAAIMITQDHGKVSNSRFSDNWLNGGSCTVNMVEKSYGPLQGLTFERNIFGTDTGIARCAIIKPLTTTLSLDANRFVDDYPFKVTRGG